MWLSSKGVRIKTYFGFGVFCTDCLGTEVSHMSAGMWPLGTVTFVPTLAPTLAFTFTFTLMLEPMPILFSPSITLESPVAMIVAFLFDPSAFSLFWTLFWSIELLICSPNGILKDVMWSDQQCILPQVGEDQGAGTTLFLSPNDSDYHASEKPPRGKRNRCPDATAIIHP